MRSASLVISPIARNDLNDIDQFGLRHWGATQSSTYLETIKAQLWNLTEQPQIGIEREELSQSMRSFPIKSHVVFYRIRPKHIEITRIPHARQDPLHHIR